MDSTLTSPLQPHGRAPTLACLRHATDDCHRALEALLQLEQPFTRSHYLRVLQGFASFLPAWERQVAHALPAQWRPWFEVRCRSHLLQMDLARMGCRPLPAVPAEVRLDTPAAAWGALYVMEGSALGGRVIGRALDSQHGIGPDSGGAYFMGRGEHTATQWRLFCQALEGAVSTEAERAQACAAAVHSFEALAATLRMALHRDEPAAA